MIKSFKIRIYPTKTQEDLIWKHIGSCRYIWNWMLAKQKELYAAGEKYLSAFGMIKLLTPLKNDGEHEWLSDVSKVGVSAGASAPEYIVKEIIEFLQKNGATDIVEVGSDLKEKSFPLPKEVRP